MLQLVGPSLLVFQGLQVLEKAVEVDADSERFPENWIFHQRWDRKPGKLDGKLLLSFFCKGPVDECALQADNE
jgi:hypothetical protein